MAARKKAIVMGGGIQGVCAALALVQIGFSVTIIEKQSNLMLRASLRNEGKIHLGFVYANDDSFETASLMCKGALQFAPIIEKLVGNAIDWDSLKSKKFNYSIPDSSLLSKDQLVEHYFKLNKLYQEYIINEDWHYCGSRDKNIYEGEEYIERIGETKITHVSTTEVALDLPKIREILVRKIESLPDITCMNNTEVLSVLKLGTKFQVEALSNGKIHYLESDIVVNCLWESRLTIDETFGLYEKRNYLYRLKYRLLGTIDQKFNNMASQTFALGAFGDFVNYANGNVYISWYPSCMTNTSKSITVPQAWIDPCNGIVSRDKREELVASVKSDFGNWLPLINEINFTQVDAGIIFSYGKTNIDDRTSELHKRYEIGIKRKDSYFSIDTGKFTTAPLFAKQLQDMIIA